MITINLLSWRETKLARKQKLISYLLMSVTIIAVCAFCFCHFLLRHINQYLMKKITRLELKLSEYEQLKVNHSIRKKSTNQNGIADIALAKKIFLPTYNQRNVCFTEINYRDNLIQFLGLAPSAMTLTDFLLNWNHARWFSQLQLENIQQTNDALLKFQFNGEIKK